MRAQLRAELLKQRSTRTNLGLLSALLGLVLLIVVLHGFSLPAEDLGRRSVQLTDIFGRAAMLGTLFAALLGAMSITAEFATARSGPPTSSRHSAAASSPRRYGRAC